MVKTGVFKKIAALTAAVTLVGSFAVGASAVGISTKTTYVQGSDNQKVAVTATVTDAGSEVEVTYYATNSSGDVVYVDQDTASTAGSATFNYVTAAANLKSDVKVGYTGATAATPSDVTGYTITCGDKSSVVPTENEGGTFTFAYAMPDGKALDTVTSDDATVVSASYSNGTLTVVLGAVTKDTTLNVVLKDATVLNPTGSYIQGAAIVSDGTNDEVTEGSGDVTSAAGNRKLSVIGQVKDSDVYGIIVSEEAITDGNVTELPSEGVYQAKGKNAEGYFAVQLIDTAATETAEFIKAGTPYYTAIYYATESGYTIVANTNTVTAVAQ